MNRDPFRTHAQSAESSAWLLVGCTAGLLAIGFATAMSVAAPGQYDDALRAHGTNVAAAIAAFLVALRVDLDRIRRAAPWIACAVALLLVAVLIPGLGHASHGARRWITWLGYSFQPSELAKVAILLFLSDFIAREPHALTDLRRGFLPAAGVVLVLAGLVLAEPDLGTSVYLVVLGGALLAVGGAPTPYLIGSGLLAIPGILMVAFRAFDHVRHRRVDSMQVLQSLRALGEGGPFGVGYGAGRMKLGHVPEGSNDFILALVGEEWGFAGTVTVLALFGGILVAGARGARACHDPFARLIVFGVPFAIGFQAVFNIAVVTGVAPPKGIALPFVSSGGSALLAFSLAIGLAVSALRRETERAPSAPSLPARAARVPASGSLEPAAAPAPASPLEVSLGQP